MSISVRIKIIKTVHGKYIQKIFKGKALVTGIGFFFFFHISFNEMV